MTITRQLLRELAVNTRDLHAEYLQLAAAHTRAADDLRRTRQYLHCIPLTERRALEAAEVTADIAASACFQAYLDAQDLPRDACNADIILELLDASSEKPPAAR